MEREVSGEKEGCEGFLEEGELRPQRQGQLGMVTRDTRPRKPEKVRLEEIRRQRKKA